MEENLVLSKCTNCFFKVIIFYLKFDLQLFLYTLGYKRIIKPLRYIFIRPTYATFEKAS